MLSELIFSEEIEFDLFELDELDDTDDKDKLDSLEILSFLELNKEFLYPEMNEESGLALTSCAELLAILSSMRVGSGDFGNF